MIHTVRVAWYTLWKSNMIHTVRVAWYTLRVAWYTLRVAWYTLRVAWYTLRVAWYTLWESSMICIVRLAWYTLWEYHDTHCECAWYTLWEMIHIVRELRVTHRDITVMISISNHNCKTQRNTPDFMNIKHITAFKLININLLHWRVVVCFLMESTNDFLTLMFIYTSVAPWSSLSADKCQMSCGYFNIKSTATQTLLPVGCLRLQLSVLRCQTKTFHCCLSTAPSGRGRRRLHPSIGSPYFWNNKWDLFCKLRGR